jgi:LacI family transcriptional regulator
VSVPHWWKFRRCASWNALAIEDPITAAAVRYIRDHVNEGISVKDVLAKVGRSRTDLELRFRRWLMRSVRGEIIRRRLEQACSLLRQTDLSLGEVSRQTGFSATSHFCRLFQNRLGCTPSQYRRSRPG